MRRCRSRVGVALAMILGLGISALANSRAAADDLSYETIRRIRNAILEWRDAWETKDIDRYVACYASAFRSRGMDLAAFKAYKKTVFDNAGTVDVELSHVEISFARGAPVARFVQHYQSASTSDVGEKTLRFTQEKGAWKIVAEEWIARGP